MAYNKYYHNIVNPRIVKTRIVNTNPVSTPVQPFIVNPDPVNKTAQQLRYISKLNQFTKNSYTNNLLFNIDDPTQINSVADVLSRSLKRTVDTFKSGSLSEKFKAVTNITNSIITFTNPMSSGIYLDSNLLKDLGSLMWNTTIKPIAEGKPSVALLNTLTNVGETTGLAANFVKAIVSNVPGFNGIIKDTAGGNGVLEDLYNAFGLGDKGRANFDFDIKTGNGFADFVLNTAGEIAFDPMTYLSGGFSVLGAAGKTSVINQSTDAAIDILKKITPGLVDELGERGAKVATRAIIKKAMKGVFNSEGNIEDIVLAGLKQTVNKSKSKLVDDATKAIANVIQINAEKIVNTTNLTILSKIKAVTDVGDAIDTALSKAGLYTSAPYVPVVTKAAKYGLENVSEALKNIRYESYKPYMQSDGTASFTKANDLYAADKAHTGSFTQAFKRVFGKDYNPDTSASLLRYSAMTDFEEITKLFNSKTLRNTEDVIAFTNNLTKYFQTKHGVNNFAEYVDAVKKANGLYNNAFEDIVKKYDELQSALSDTIAVAKKSEQLSKKAKDIDDILATANAAYVGLQVNGKTNGYALLKNYNDTQTKEYAITARNIIQRRYLEGSLSEEAFNKARSFIDSFVSGETNLKTFMQWAEENDMLKALASTDNDVLDMFLNRVKTAFPDITEDQIKQLTYSVTKSKSISVDFMNELTETRINSFKQAKQASARYASEARFNKQVLTDALNTPEIVYNQDVQKNIINALEQHKHTNIRKAIDTINKAIDEPRFNEIIAPDTARYVYYDKRLNKALKILYNNNDDVLFLALLDYKYAVKDLNKALEQGIPIAHAKNDVTEAWHKVMDILVYREHSEEGLSKAGVELHKILIQQSNRTDKILKPIEFNAQIKNELTNYRILLNNLTNFLDTAIIDRTQTLEDILLELNKQKQTVLQLLNRKIFGISQHLERYNIGTIEAVNNLKNTIITHDIVALAKSRVDNIAGAVAYSFKLEQAYTSITPVTAPATQKTLRNLVENPQSVLYQRLQKLINSPDPVIAQTAKVFQEHIKQGLIYQDHLVEPILNSSAISQDMKLAFISVLNSPDIAKKDFYTIQANLDTVVEDIFKRVEGYNTGIKMKKSYSNIAWAEKNLTPDELAQLHNGGYDTFIQAQILAEELPKWALKDNDVMFDIETLGLLETSQAKPVVEFSITKANGDTVTYKVKLDADAQPSYGAVEAKFPSTNPQYADLTHEEKVQRYIADYQGTPGTVENIKRTFKGKTFNEQVVWCNDEYDLLTKAYSELSTYERKGGNIISNNGNLFDTPYLRTRFKNYDISTDVLNYNNLYDMRALRQQADGIKTLTGAEKQQMMNILENYIAVKDISTSGSIDNTTEAFIHCLDENLSTEATKLGFTELADNLGKIYGTEIKAVNETLGELVVDKAFINTPEGKALIADVYLNTLKSGDEAAVNTIKKALYDLADEEYLQKAYDLDTLIAKVRQGDEESIEIMRKLIDSAFETNNLNKTLYAGSEALNKYGYKKRVEIDRLNEWFDIDFIIQHNQEQYNKYKKAYAELVASGASREVIDSAAANLKYFKEHINAVGVDEVTDKLTTMWKRWNSLTESISNVKLLQEYAEDIKSLLTDLLGDKRYIKHLFNKNPYLQHIRITDDVVHNYILLKECLDTVYNSLDIVDYSIKAKRPSRLFNYDYRVRFNKMDLPGRIMQKPIPNTSDIYTDYILKTIADETDNVIGKYSEIVSSFEQGQLDIKQMYDALDATPACRPSVQRAASNLRDVQDFYKTLYDVVSNYPPYRQREFVKKILLFQDYANVAQLSNVFDLAKDPKQLQSFLAYNGGMFTFNLKEIRIPQYQNMHNVLNKKLAVLIDADTSGVLAQYGIKVYTSGDRIVVGFAPDAPLKFFKDPNTSVRQVYFNNELIERFDYKKYLPEQDYKVFFKDAGLNDVSEDLGDKFNKIRNNVHQLTNKQSIGSNLEVLSKGKLKDIYEALPEDIRTQMFDYNQFLTDDYFSEMLFNNVNLGRVKYQKEIQPMLPRTFITSLKSTTEIAVEQSKTATQYIQMLFNGDTGIYKGYWGKDIPEINNALIRQLKEHPEYKLVALVEDSKKPMGCKLVSFSPSNAKQLNKARELHASILPVQTYSTIMTVLEQNNLQHPALKFFSKINAMFKMGSLVSLGTWRNNYLDSTLKSMLDTKSVMGVLEKQHEARKLLKGYDNALMEIITFKQLDVKKLQQICVNYGITMQDLADDIFLKGMDLRNKTLTSILNANALLDKYNTCIEDICKTNQFGFLNKDSIDFYFKYMNNAEETGFTREMFDFIHNYLKDSASAGDTSVYNKLLKEHLQGKGKSVAPDGMLDAVINHLGRVEMRPMYEIEQTVRLAQHMLQTEAGMGFTESTYMLNKTHFDYGLRTKTDNILELAFPFITYKFKNLQYWIDTLERNPWLLRYYTTIMENIWDRDNYSEYELNRNKSLQYNMASGAIPLLNNMVYKTRPSMVDALNIIASPIDSVVGSLSTPLKSLYNAVAQKEYDQLLNLVPVVGTAYTQYGKTGMAGYERTGNVLPLLLPHMFGGVKRFEPYQPTDYRQVIINKIKSNWKNYPTNNYKRYNNYSKVNRAARSFRTSGRRGLKFKTNFNYKKYLNFNTNYYYKYSYNPYNYNWTKRSYSTYRNYPTRLYSRALRVYPVRDNTYKKYYTKSGKKRFDLMLMGGPKRTLLTRMRNMYHYYK